MIYIDCYFVGNGTRKIRQIYTLNLKYENKTNIFFAGFYKKAKILLK